MIWNTSNVQNIPLSALSQQNIEIPSGMHHNRVYIKLIPQQKIRHADDHNQGKHGPGKQRAYLELLKYQEIETQLPSFCASYN